MFALFSRLFQPTGPAGTTGVTWRQWVTRGLTEFAAFVGLGLLATLWAAEVGLPNVAWVLLATVAVFAAILLFGPLRLADLRLALLVFAFLLIYLIGISISYFFVVETHPGRHDLYVAQCAAVLLSAITFGLGALAGRTRAWIGFVLALFAIAIFVMVSEANFSTAELVRRYGPDEVIAGFQQMGDSVILCGLVVASRIRRPILAYLFTALCIALLVMIPSRSSIVLGALSLGIVCIISSPPKMRLFMVAIGLVVAIMLRLLVTTPLNDSVGSNPTTTAGATANKPSAPRANAAPERGVLTAAEGAAQDEREKMFDSGMDAILEHPIAGWFGFQLDAFNRPGMHMRNVLDAWAQAGLLPFVAFLGLWAVLIRQWYLSFRVNRELANRVLPMLAFPALAWLLTRHVGYPALYFCLGFYAAVLAYGFDDSPQYSISP